MTDKNNSENSSNSKDSIESIESDSDEESSNASDVESDTLDSPTSLTQKKPSRRKIFTVIGVGLVLSIGGSAGYVFGVEPQIKKSQAVKELNNVSENRGPITVSNNNVFDFETTTISDAPENQKALGANEAYESASFSFTNGKNNASKTLEVYLDLSSQRSRDFITFNSSSLKSMVENGEINLNVHPAPKSSPFSAYSYEAIALAVEKAPDRAWSLILELAKLSMTVDDKNIAKADEILKLIVDSSRTAGISEITAEDIKAGSYMTWVAAAAVEPALVNGGTLPVLYINGELVNHDTVDINNSQTLSKHIRNGR